MSQIKAKMLSADVLVLTEDQIADAAFRASDLAWSVVLNEFTRQQEESGLTYKDLGQRIRRSKSQVQRWLSSPFSMNIRSLGLLAEGLDVDLEIELKDRVFDKNQSNYLHPAERAKSSYRQSIDIMSCVSANFSAGSYFDHKDVSDYKSVLQVFKLQGGHFLQGPPKLKDDIWEAAVG